MWALFCMHVSKAMYSPEHIMTKAESTPATTDTVLKERDYSLEAVVEEFRPVVSHKLVTKGTDFAVHDQGFGIQVCESEDCHGR
jgi:hypothetical protein